jgi:drug/metabolite transporter (DMT)-like permease
MNLSDTETIYKNHLKKIQESKIIFTKEVIYLIKFIVLFALCIFSLVCGQILWKVGITEMGGFIINSHEFLSSIRKVTYSPFIWIGSFCYVLGTLLWFNILSYLELSYALPILSASYIFSFLVSWIFLGENVSLLRFTGIIVICLGIYLVARS